MVMENTPHKELEQNVFKEWKVAKHMKMKDNVNYVIKVVQVTIHMIGGTSINPQK